MGVWSGSIVRFAPADGQCPLSSRVGDHQPHLRDGHRAERQSSTAASSRTPAASQRLRPTQSRRFVSHEAANGVVERCCARLPAASLVRVPHECCVPGQWLCRGEGPLETRLEVDRDHHPCEEAADGVSSVVPTLRVSAASQQRRRGSERSHDDLVDQRGIEMSAEREVLVRDSKPVDESDHAPGEVLRPRHRGVMGQGPPRAAPILAHPVVDSLGIVVPQRRRRSKRHEEERRARAIG